MHRCVETGQAGVYPIQGRLKRVDRHRVAAATAGQIAQVQYEIEFGSSEFVDQRRQEHFGRALELQATLFGSVVFSAQPKMGVRAKTDRNRFIHRSDPIRQPDCDY